MDGVDQPGDKNGDNIADTGDRFRERHGVVPGRVADDAILDTRRRLTPVTVSHPSAADRPSSESSSMVTRAATDQ